jgi:hypothetical protein
VLEDLRRRTDRSGLEIIMIDVWEGTGAREQAQRYCDMWQLRATVLLDETAQFTRDLGVRGVPTNVVVDADGTVLDVGASSGAALRAAVAGLVPKVNLDAEPGDERAGWSPS